MQTYKVMLSLLFEHKRYADVFELYDNIRKHLELYELFPDKTINCLAFGACYNLVSESVNSLWIDILRRISMYFAEHSWALPVCKGSVEKNKQFFAN